MTLSNIPTSLAELIGVPLSAAHLSAGFALLAAFLFALSAHVQNMAPKNSSTQFGTLVVIATQAAIYLTAGWFVVQLSYWFTTAALMFGAAGLLRPSLSMTLWMEGIKRLGPTLNAALTSIGPFFAAVFGIVLLGEQLTPLIAAGIGLVICGALLPALRSSGIAYAFPLWALLLPLGASALRNVAHAVTKLGFAEVPSPLFAAMVSTCVSLVIVGTRFVANRQAIEGRIRDYRYFVASGIVSAMAVYLLNQALQHGQVITVAPIVASSPVFTALLGYFVFGRENLNWRTILTIALIVPGVVLIVLASAH
jgi:drug/metabolite transporter (DMT)-like permease